MISCHSDRKVTETPTEHFITQPSTICEDKEAGLGDRRTGCVLQDEVGVYNRRHGCCHHCKDCDLHCTSLCVDKNSPRGAKKETGQPRRGL